jgi:aspartyl-tRNA(Asn)/glutamyl-tRNA(Gln) amidotransferase subunit C
MLEIKDIEKLAKLARIQLTQEEMEKLLKEVDPILGYVAQLKEVVSTVSEEKVAGELRNITREDANPTITGVNTKVIVENMPDSQDNYLKVEKIL